MQVSGLTRLMMEGKKDEAGGAGGRRENRRETWAPGIAGGAALNTAVDRLFAMLSKPSTAPLPCCAACFGQYSWPPSASGWARRQPCAQAPAVAGRGGARGGGRF